MRIIDIPGNETAREQAVVAVVIGRAECVEVKARRSALDAKTALQLEVSDLGAQHPVRCVDVLVVCEIRDTCGIGTVHGHRIIEHLRVER